MTFLSNERLDGTGFNATYQFLNEVEVYRPMTTTSGGQAFGKTLHSKLLESLPDIIVSESKFLKLVRKQTTLTRESIILNRKISNFTSFSLAICDLTTVCV